MGVAESRSSHHEFLTGRVSRPHLGHIGPLSSIEKHHLSVASYLDLTTLVHPRVGPFPPSAVSNPTQSRVLGREDLAKEGRAWCWHREMKMGNGNFWLCRFDGAARHGNLFANALAQSVANSKSAPRRGQVHFFGGCAMAQDLHQTALK